MVRYTVKMDENGALFLLNEQGERQSVLQLLKDCGNSRVVALDAPMGTGKTTLIKQICEEMGTEDVVNSPTFAIVNVYEVESPAKGLKSKVESKEEVYHFDCYRLKSLVEAMDLGAEEYLYSGNWCFVEWPEIIVPILPEETVMWKIRQTENGDREIVICDL